MKLFSVLFAVVSFIFSQPALAGAPKSTSENSGAYHFSLGSFQITTISDGFITLPVAKFLKGPAAKISAGLKKNFLGDDVATSINTFLINTGAQLVLVDTGTGKLMGSSGGHLVENLRAAGYKPEQVDAIVITHAHPDHIGGLANDGKIVFPNATVYLDKNDLDMIKNTKGLEKAPPEAAKRSEFTLANITPYEKAGKLKAFSKNGEIVPGISSHASHGHTPGHTSYLIESDGQKLVLLGDLVHVAAVQFENPSVRMGFDADGNAAEKERVTAFQEAAKTGEWLGSAHLPFPGVGHLRKEKSGFVFVGINYPTPAPVIKL